MRRTPVLSLSLASALLTGGCIADLRALGEALAPDSDTADVSTSEAPTPTTADDAGVQTATGEQDTTGTSSEAPQSDMGAPVDAAPKITQFDGIPDYIGEAGPIELQLITSPDVVSVALSLDDVVLADDLTPANFPRPHFFTSAADNGPARRFKVVVTDDEGLQDQAEATVTVLLPKSGAEKCIFTDPDAGAVISVITALEYTDRAIVAVGSRDSGAGPRLAVWKLDPDTCKLQDGWPRALGNWTGDSALDKLDSFGAAVDVDATENLVVAGNFIVAGVPRSYVALLNAGGSLLWEHVGPAGDEVAGVAATNDEYHGVHVVGSRRTSNDPVYTDGAIWMYRTDNNKVFVGAPKILAGPFTNKELEDDMDNERSERVRAVVIQPGTGNALAVGEREFKPAEKIVRTRAFTALIDPLGELIGDPWTSPADTWFPNDAARSVAVCGNQFVAGGWTLEELPGADSRPMIFWIEADGTSVEQRAELTLWSTETHGIACDREQKVVSAATGTQGAAEAEVFMVPDSSGPRLDYEQGVAGADGAGAAACDSRGFCGWGGYRSDNGKPYAVVRVHHP